ncbi:hypothetical protein GCM10027403_03480 [Arthrobacter tecti]
MTTAGLTITLTLLAALAVMQILLIAGLPFGNYAWGGQHRVLPPRLRTASIVAILLYAVFAALLMSRAGVLPGGDTVPVVVATWVLFAYSALSIIGNLASRSHHERIAQTPVSILLTIGILLIALGHPG